MHCTKNSKQIFPEMKLRGLVFDLYIRVSGSDLYISTIGLFGISFTLKAKKKSSTRIICFYSICITASGSGFHQLLAATRRRRRKSPNLSFWACQPISINQANFGLVSPFQSTRQLWARPPFSINQATLGSSALFNQPGNIGQRMAWDCFFYLPQQLTPPSPPTSRTNGPTYPTTPFGRVASVCGLWPQCGQLKTT
jgi:hypothetical protein